MSVGYAAFVETDTLIKKSRDWNSLLSYLQTAINFGENLQKNSRPTFKLGLCVPNGKRMTEQVNWAIEMDSSVLTEMRGNPYVIPLPFVWSS